jgi:Asp-tRNA(Asn)/Glu-tRNA(Gln) amidotransferase C subunit
MKDAMDIARQMQQQHIDKIARLEIEIEALRERVSELETFLEFGETLINGGLDEEDDQRSAPAAPAVNVSREKPELRNVLPDDDWSADDDEEEATQQSIARVLSNRNT